MTVTATDPNDVETTETNAPLHINSVTAEETLTQTPESLSPESANCADAQVARIDLVSPEPSLADELQDLAANSSQEVTEEVDPNATSLGDIVDEVPAETCPKCHTTTPWKASSWCPECGYYPGVTDAVPVDAAPVEVEEVVEESVAPPPMLAPWIVKSIATPTVIVVFSILARYYFTYYGGNRGLVALLLFLAGGFAFFIAHLRTSLLSINETPDNNLFDMIAKPIEMWRPTIRGLPNTDNRLALGIGGLTAMLAATMIIGGIDFGSLLDREEIKEDKNKPGIIKKLLSYGAAKAGKPDKKDAPESIEDALDQLASPIPELDPAKAALLPSPDEPLKCVVYGFMKDGKEDFGRILLAANIKGKRVHVGTIDASSLPKHARKNLAERLNAIVTEETSMQSPYAGTWVKPTIGLPITFDKWSFKGELINPEIGSKKKKD